MITGGRTWRAYRSVAVMSLVWLCGCTGLRLATQDVNTGARRVLLQVGDIAPPFSLPTQDGTEITLGDLLGSGEAVLLFYRGRLCPICPPRTPELQEYYLRLNTLGVPLVAISIDEPAETARLAERFDLSFPLLSDVDRAISRAYGVEDDPTDEGIPSIFVVSREGRILWRSTIDDDERADPQEVIDAILDRRAAPEP